MKRFLIGEHAEAHTHACVHRGAHAEAQMQQSTHKKHACTDASVQLSTGKKGSLARERSSQAAKLKGETEIFLTAEPKLKGHSHHGRGFGGGGERRYILGGG